MTDSLEWLLHQREISVSRENLSGMVLERSRELSIRGNISMKQLYLMKGSAELDGL